MIRSKRRFQKQAAIEAAILDLLRKEVGGPLERGSGDSGGRQAVVKRACWLSCPWPPLPQLPPCCRPIPRRRTLMIRSTLCARTRASLSGTLLCPWEWGDVAHGTGCTCWSFSNACWRSCLLLWEQRPGWEASAASLEAPSVLLIGMNAAEQCLADCLHFPPPARWPSGLHIRPCVCVSCTLPCVAPSFTCRPTVCPPHDHHSLP